jgi:uncharacterized membrane protein YcjF (UPF0283 family)
MLTVCTDVSGLLYFTNRNKMGKITFIIALVLVCAATVTRAADDVEAAWQKYQVNC